MNFHGESRDFHPTKIDFKDFEQSPDRAILLWLLNAGLDISEWISRLPNTLAQNKLLQEIQSHTLDTSELEQLKQDFLKAQGLATAAPIAKEKPASINSHLLACSTCGIRNMSTEDVNPYNEVMLTEISSLLEVKGDRFNKYMQLKNASPIEIPIDDKFTLKKVYLQSVMSIYHSKTNDKLYNVHPELVHTNSSNAECLMLCHSCYEHFFNKGIPSPNSIANGIDHGDTDRIGLSKPNVLERMLISRVRVYHALVKIKKILNPKTYCKETECMDMQSCSLMILPQLLLLLFYCRNLGTLKKVLHLKSYKLFVMTQ